MTKADGAHAKLLDNDIDKRRNKEQVFFQNHCRSLRRRRSWEQTRGRKKQIQYPEELGRTGNKEKLIVKIGSYEIFITFLRTETKALYFIVKRS